MAQQNETRILRILQASQIMDCLNCAGDFDFGSGVRKARLIGAHLDTGAALLLLWHSKDPSMTSDDQRMLMNLSCSKAIERKQSIDTRNLAT